MLDAIHAVDVHATTTGYGVFADDGTGFFPSWRASLAAVGRITAVLDWLDAQYGDFLYDVAWLDFWSSGFAFPERCVAHYAERILCYQRSIALNVLRFFAQRQNVEAYRFARHAILSHLG
jgi:hygromycin-B 4-O-kinase